VHFHEPGSVYSLAILYYASIPCLLLLYASVLPLRSPFVCDLFSTRHKSGVVVLG